MITKWVLKLLIPIVATALLAACGDDDDGAPPASTTSAVTVRTATLDGAQEVPPLMVTGTGQGAVVVDNATREISGGFTFTGLTGNATAAHIHLGAPGVAGGVEIGLTLVSDTGVPFAAIVPAGTVLTQAQFDALNAGNLYFNVHTVANSDGEIRGQLTGTTGFDAAVATLTGDQEVPPVTTSATGKGALVVNSTTRAIVIAAESFSGVTPTFSHIHQAPAGVDGGVIVDLFLSADDGAGNFVATAAHDAVLTQDQYDALLAGNLYFNVHSAANPDGEIRGQLAVQ